MRKTRSYAIFLDPSKFGNGVTDRKKCVDECNSWFSSELANDCTFDDSKSYERYIEHFSFDTKDNKLKSDKEKHRQECVVKFERNIREKSAQITCKFKSFDAELVTAFPVKIDTTYSATYSSDSNDSDESRAIDLRRPNRNNSSKLEIDFHSLYSRTAISLVVSISYNYEFKVWNDIEKIFPGILQFLNIDPSEVVHTR